MRGKDITPFLLDYIHEHTDRTSVSVNLEIVRGNCRLGAEIARAWSASRPTSDPSARRYFPAALPCCQSRLTRLPVTATSCWWASNA